MPGYTGLNAVENIKKAFDAAIERDETRRNL
jgi:hypothetical protein